MYPRSTPGRVLGNHSEDQFAQFLANASSAYTGPMSRKPRPICLESRSVPSHDGLRLNKNQCLLPSRPDPPQHTQNNRSKVAKRGCGRLCLKTANCCRSARFSRSRPERERKKRVGKVNRSHSRRSMKLVLHELGQMGCSVDLPDSNVDRHFGEAQRFPPVITVKSRPHLLQMEFWRATG